MLIGAIADIHGNFDAMRRAMTRHAEVPWWVCVGDVASSTGAYPEPPAPRTGSRATTKSSIGLRTGSRPRRAAESLLHQERLRCASVHFSSEGGGMLRSARHSGGTTAAHAKDDKRRHFVHEEIEACKRLDGVDILMTHEAPRPFIVSAEGDSRPAKRWDAGKRPINELLAAVRPRLHLCGHHHRFAGESRGSAVGLHRPDQPVLSAHRRLHAEIPED